MFYEFIGRQTHRDRPPQDSERTASSERDIAAMTLPDQQKVHLLLVIRATGSSSVRLPDRCPVRRKTAKRGNAGGADECLRPENNNINQDLNSDVYYFITW